jgi:hypothetical protein
MKRAKPSELCGDVAPVIQASVPLASLYRLIPVRMTKLDPLAESEPSIGALLRLSPGLLAVAVYGLDTRTLTLLLPKEKVSEEAIKSLLRHVRIPDSSILWSQSLEQPQELARA